MPSSEHSYKLAPTGIDAMWMCAVPVMGARIAQPYIYVQVHADVLYIQSRSASYDRITSNYL